MRDELKKAVFHLPHFGKRRIKATFIALSIGLPLVLLSGYLQSLTALAWLELTIELAIILIGALLTLCVAEVAGCKTFCGLSAAIFIILIVSHSDGETLTYSLLRAAQTIMGVFVAWLINVKLFPYHGEKKSSEYSDKKRTACRQFSFAICETGSLDPFVLTPCGHAAADMPLGFVFVQHFFDLQV